MGSDAIALSVEECEALLNVMDVGRIAVVEDGFPLVFPISYRITTYQGGWVIAIRTRPGNVIDHPGRPVCFEIDGVDPGRDGGWSVLVRGMLSSVAPDPARDPEPIDSEGRDAWLVVVPVAVSGRRVTSRPLRWSFHIAGYL